MAGSWLPSLHWLMSNITLTLAFALILLNWRLPLIRNLALLNFIVSLAGSQLMIYVSNFSLQETRYFLYLAEATVNLSKVLTILLLIGCDIKYLCKTAIQLISIFSILGCINIARFIDRFVFDGGLDDGGFAASYSVITPALNSLALFVLVVPFVVSLLPKEKATDHYPQP